MIKFEVTIGGENYKVEATDRKLLSLLTSFDDRIVGLLGKEVVESEVSEIINLGTILDDRRLGTIDRWLASQNAPSLSESASVQEVVNFLKAVMESTVGSLNGAN